MFKVVVCCLLIPAFFFGCSSNNVTVDDGLQRYFDSAGVKGAFGLFDNGHGHFTICNLSRYSDSFYLPGESFDILQSLIAIQTGVLKDDLARMRLDRPDAPQETMPAATLGESFRDTTELNRQQFDLLYTRALRKDTVRKWVDSLQYGNKRLGDSAGAIFWADDTLRINCDEQLGLLKKLYFNQLPFFARTQEIVCRMMPSESNSMFRFCYKTAMGRAANGHGIGWTMGWVEENKHPYFFVVNLESADTGRDLRKTGLEIAKKILRQEGFFLGKR